MAPIQRFVFAWCLLIDGIIGIITLGFWFPRMSHHYDDHCGEVFENLLKSIEIEMTRLQYINIEAVGKGILGKDLKHQGHLKIVLAELQSR